MCGIMASDLGILVNHHNPVMASGRQKCCYNKTSSLEILSNMQVTNIIATSIKQFRHRPHVHVYIK